MKTSEWIIYILVVGLLIAGFSLLGTDQTVLGIVLVVAGALLSLGYLIEVKFKPMNATLSTLKETLAAEGLVHDDAKAARKRFSARGRSSSLRT